MKSLKHYMVLGAWFGGCALLVAIVRALPELPGKLKDSSGWPDFIASIPWMLGLVAGFLLLGACIGWLVGWAKLHTEKRTGTS